MALRRFDGTGQECTDKVDIDSRSWAVAEFQKQMTGRTRQKKVEDATLLAIFERIKLPHESGRRSDDSVTGASIFSYRANQFGYVFKIRHQLGV